MDSDDDTWESVAMPAEWEVLLNEHEAAAILKGLAKGHHARLQAARQKAEAGAREAAKQLAIDKYRQRRLMAKKSHNTATRRYTTAQGEVASSQSMAQKEQNVERSALAGEDGVHASKWMDTGSHMMLSWAAGTRLHKEAKRAVGSCAQAYNAARAAEIGRSYGNARVASIGGTSSVHWGSRSLTRCARLGARALPAGIARVAWDLVQGEFKRHAARRTRQFKLNGMSV